MRPTPVARPARPPPATAVTNVAPTRNLRKPSTFDLPPNTDCGTHIPAARKAKRDQRNAFSAITLSPRMSHTISARFCPARFRQPAAASRIEGEQASGRRERRHARFPADRSLSGGPAASASARLLASGGRGRAASDRHRDGALPDRGRRATLVTTPTLAMKGTRSGRRDAQLRECCRLRGELNCATKEICNERQGKEVRRPHGTALRRP
jgi:hypothetical protein